MLDGGPSRVPRSIDRRPVQGRGAAPRQTDGPQAPAREVYRSSTPGDGASPKNRFVKPAIVVAIIIVLCVAGWIVWSNLRDSGSVAIDSSKYQAVHLSSGNVFFGKLEIINDEHLKLTEVFYAETVESDQAAEGQQGGENTTKLIPFEDYIYGPEDEMVIDRSQVVFFTNLKSDSGAGKLINDHKSKS